METAVTGNSTLRAVARPAIIVAGQVILIGLSLYIFLGGPRRDFGVPFGMSVDSLLAVMQSKSTIDNGWWWFNPMLAAPSGFDQLAFPANSNVDQAVVWAVSRIVPEPMAAINLAWMTMVVLSGLSATWCMRVLGASRVSAFVAGTLFALSPYALYRNIGHIWMVIYLVPFGCTAALLLTWDPRRIFELSRRSIGLLLVGCALLGFNYVYYAFFTCFILLVAAAIGAIAHRDWRPAGAAAICIALVGACTWLNLYPSLNSWREHGRPIIIRQKVAAESEVYGLKIRHLVSPVFGHSFAPLRRWGERESAARFPLETENMTSRLGLVATVGFLGLLGLLFVPGAVDGSPARASWLGASRLSLAAVLLGTVGGFGSLVSLLITPEIRAYNRIAPFIAFLALAAVALALDALCKSPRRRLVAGAMVLLVGLGDQRAAAAGLNSSYAENATEFAALKAFVQRLEAELPDRAMVVQLPFRTYLNDSGIARLQSYEHLKLYAVSRRLRWQYPAMSNEQVRWQLAAGRLDPHRLAGRLATEGFAAVIVDRFGYEDSGAAVSAALLSELGDGHVIADTERYLALDIRTLASTGAASESFSGLSAPATAGLPSCGRPPATGIDHVGGRSLPVDGQPVRINGGAENAISGWAIDQDRTMAASGIDLPIDERLIPGVYGLERDDVAAYFKQPRYLGSGFVLVVPPGTLSEGRHTLRLRVAASAGDCYYEHPGLDVIVH